MVGFPTPAYATNIEIYETYLAPLVLNVEIIDSSGTQILVYSGPDTTTCGSALSVQLDGSVLVASVLIYVTPGSAIDAVRMTYKLAPPPVPHPSPSPPPPTFEMHTALGLDISEALLQARSEATGLPVLITLDGGGHHLYANASIFDEQMAVSEVSSWALGASALDCFG